MENSMCHNPIIIPCGCFFSIHDQSQIEQKGKDACFIINWQRVAVIVFTDLVANWDFFIVSLSCI